MNEEVLQDIFLLATDVPVEERSAFVAKACGGNLAMQREIESLLVADAVAEQEAFWRRSALHHHALAADDAEAVVGETIGHYRLAELVGRGGMGAVYRAERIDAEFEKNVAIKLIHGFFYSADVISHFRAERQILANLEHPNIARLLDGGTRADGAPYLVMEYIEGSTPYDYCCDQQLSTTQRLLLFRQICSAVHYAHQHMVIHRDLKPANILVTADGTPKLLDFGIAKIMSPDALSPGQSITGPGLNRLTARYASPEQVRGEPVTTASDVYSLGVILYELLTGHYPYGDADRPTHEIMGAVCEAEPTKPSAWAPKLKGDLDNIILRALRKAPSERYASADQFSEDIRRYLEGHPVQARGDAPLYVATKFIRRNRASVAVSILMFCLLLGSLIEVSLSRARANRRFNDVRKLAHAVMFDYADAIDRLPGSTPVRERLVKDALTYQDSLAQEADTPELRREVVDGYVRVSNVQGNEYDSNLGDTAGALVSAQKAVAGADVLLRKDHTPAGLDSAASAYSAYGSLLYSAGDLAGAERAYQRAVGLRKEIAQRTPDNIPNRIELAICLSHLGDVYGGSGLANLGRTTESLAFYQQAEATSQALSNQHPNDLDVEKESYETLMSLSAAENVLGAHTEAIRDLQNSTSVIEKVLAVEPHDTIVRFELANVNARLAQMLVDARQADKAIPHLSRAAALLQELLDADPANALFRRAQPIVENQLSIALRSAGRASEGVPHSEKALRLVQALTKDSPKSTQYRMDLGVTERILSEVLLAAGTTSEALLHAQRATSLLCNADSSASDPSTVSNCGKALLASGNALLALHDIGAARSVLQQSETIASTQSEKDPKNVTLRSNAARAQAAYASALTQNHDLEPAEFMYKQALQNWSSLMQNNSITAEDLHRASDATLALSALRSLR